MSPSNRRSSRELGGAPGAAVSDIEADRPDANINSLGVVSNDGSISVDSPGIVLDIPPMPGQLPGGRAPAAAPRFPAFGPV